MSTAIQETRDAAPGASRSPWVKVFGVVVGLAIAVCLMALAFLTPSLHSGPHDLPLAISGPEAMTDQMTGQLESAQPGAFDPTVYAEADEVTEAVAMNEDIGGVSVDPDGAITITTAGAAGAPYATLLKGLGSTLEQSGAAVTYADVAPLTKDDPSGVGLSTLGLPLAFGGMFSAVLLSNLLKNRPWHRIAGSLLASLAVGFALVALLQFGFGAIDGSYIVTSLALALGVAAVSLFILAMESLWGFAGLGIGAVLMMFVANPLSGLATGWHWLPEPWGFIGQLLPIGSAGTLLRSTAFFEGHGATLPVLVLSAWAILGIAGVAVSAALGRKTTQHGQQTTPA